MPKKSQFLSRQLYQGMFAEILEDRRVLASVTFQPETIIAASDVADVRDVSLADVDGDGDDDILYSSHRDFGWFQNGGTEFSQRKILEIDWPAHWQVDQATTADIDGDGDLDISFNLRSTGLIVDHPTLRHGRPGLNWVENLDGQAAFGPVKHISPANSILTLDVDNDDDIDFVSMTNQEVTWIENQDVGFSDPLPLIDSEYGPYFNLQGADLDQDGDNDIVIAKSDTITWYENANGVFHEKLQIKTDSDILMDLLPPPSPLPLELIDLDGDGDKDIISALHAASEVAWYENSDARGTFTERKNFPTAPRASGLAATDVDADGRTDLILSGYNQNGATGLLWIQQVEAKGFKEPQIIDDLSATIVEVGRIDGDSQTEIVSVDIPSNQILSFDLDVKSNTFRGRTLNPRALAVSDIKVVDLDADGDDDLLTGSHDGSLVWYEGTEDHGNFTVRHKVATLTQIGSIVAADMDGDGDLDVAASGTLDVTDYSLVWFPNIDGSGVFGNGQTITVDLIDLAPLNAADMDGDGDTDLITAGVTMYENVDGIGTAWKSKLISPRYFSEGDSKIADLDQDGDNDIVATFRNYITIVWYENDGNGDFVSHQLDNADNAESLAIADIDQDGNLDVLANLSNQVQWYRNADGNGAFIDPLILGNIRSRGQHVFASDIDQDGDLDVVSDDHWFEHLDGVGRFGPKVRFIHGDIAVPIDWNKDGYTDIIAGFSDRIVGYKNTAAPRESFETEQLIAAADFAESASLADLDGDGDLDALLASDGGRRITWRENVDGEGSFGMPRWIDNHGEFFFAAAGDIDSDGNMDAIVSSKVDGRVFWYRNAGNGQFGGPQTITLEAGKRSSLFAGDVDLDGDLDLITKSSSSISWHENEDGKGRFGAPLTIFDDYAGVPKIVVSDLDADGDLDVATGGLFGVSWMRNDGGRFRQFDIEQERMEMTDVFDVDSDGDDDLIVIQDRVVSVLENLNGTFRSARRITSVPGGTWVTTSGDMDNDGDLDLIYSSADGSRFETKWIRNDGNFKFSTRTEISKTFSGVSPIVADFNRDGHLDIGFGRGPLVWYESQNGGKSFVEHQTLLSMVNSTQQIADINNDGHSDILNSSRAGISWLQNDGTGQFELEFIVKDVYSRANAADLDGDGDQDVVSLNITDDQLEWYENIGATFRERHIVSEGLGVRRLIPVDLDSDGDVDLLSPSDFQRSFGWWENADGKGTFERLKQLLHTTLVAREVVPFDFDQDGDADLVVASRAELYLFVNTGNATFSDSIQLDSGTIDNLQTADVDGDGDLDLVANHSGVTIWYENRDHAFDNKFLIASEGFGELSAADLDGDGDAEILASESDELIVFVNNRSLFERRSLPLPSLIDQRIASIYVADIDGDGDLDPILSSSNGSTVTWLPNIFEIPGDINRDKRLSISDVDALCRGIHGGNQGDHLDLNRDREIDGSDVDVMLERLLGTVMGDVNLDGRFDSSDLVQIFQSGQYEDSVEGNSLWSHGDWNCDGDFDSSDLVYAFQRSSFTAAAVKDVLK